MAASQLFRVLMATDGSATATAALATAVRFPWPAGITASAVVANPVGVDDRPPLVRRALKRRGRFLAANAADALSVRWRDAGARVVDAPPVEAIIEEASRVRADVIVVGWRGHGPVRRLLTGSVSRGVVRQAPCAVLVVRQPSNHIRHIVLGFRPVATLQARGRPRGGAPGAA